MKSGTSKKRRSRPKRPAKSSSTSIATSKPGLDAARVHQVYLWIIKGQHEHDIVDAIREQWPEEDHTPLIVAAMEKLLNNADFNPDLVRGWCFEAYRELYRQMVEIGDFSGALRAVKEIAQMAD